MLISLDLLALISLYIYRCYHTFISADTTNTKALAWKVYYTHMKTTIVHVLANPDVFTCTHTHTQTQLMKHEPWRASKKERKRESQKERKSAREKETKREKEKEIERSTHTYIHICVPIQ